MQKYREKYSQTQPTFIHKISITKDKFGIHYETHAAAKVLKQKVTAENQVLVNKKQPYMNKVVHSRDYEGLLPWPKPRNTSHLNLLRLQPKT